MAEQAAKKQSIFKRLKRLRLTNGRMDFVILLTVTALCAFGLVMVFSASYYYAQHYSGANNDSFFYLKKQLVYLAIGYPAMLIISLINTKFIQKLHWVFMGVSLLLYFALATALLGL